VYMLFVVLDFLVCEVLVWDKSSNTEGEVSSQGKTKLNWLDATFNVMILIARILV